ncbi:hypothetical protein LV779_39185 [Streptomyces thinghirensis]|nr:hypothetical protein [Streptomyces thinghirensis]
MTATRPGASAARPPTATPGARRPGRGPRPHPRQTGGAAAPVRAGRSPTGPRPARRTHRVLPAGRALRQATAQVATPPAGDPVTPDRTTSTLWLPLIASAPTSTGGLSHEGAPSGAASTKFAYLVCRPALGSPRRAPLSPAPAPTHPWSPTSPPRRVAVHQDADGRGVPPRDHVVGGDLVPPGAPTWRWAGCPGELRRWGLPGRRGVDDLVRAVAPVRLAPGTHLGNPPSASPATAPAPPRGARHRRGRAPVHAGGTLRFDDPGPRPAPVAPADVRGPLHPRRGGNRLLRRPSYGPASRTGLPSKDRRRGPSPGPGEALARSRRLQWGGRRCRRLPPSLLDAAPQTAGRPVLGAGEPTGARTVPAVPPWASVRLYALRPERYAYATPGPAPRSRRASSFRCRPPRQNVGRRAPSLHRKSRPPTP